MVRRRCAWAVVLAFLAALLTARSALADTTTSLGDGGGEAGGPFAGLLQAPEANLFSGALSHVIPIRIPPGRKNATPDLKLVYSSLGGGSGLLGEGWSLPLGTIERSTKHGVPRCGTAGHDNTRDFVLTLNGATVELAEYSSGSNPIHRPRTDQSFLEAVQKPSSNTWEVIERSGMRYFFGETAESRLSRTEGCAFTAVWGLTHVQDPNGNTIHITYKPDEQSLVPIRIEYGGQASGSHPFVLEFAYLAYDPLKTKAIPSYQKGVREEVNDLLDTITVEADGQTVRTYQLHYDDESPMTGCSSARKALLCQVSVDALPTQTFQYAPDDFGMGVVTTTQYPPATNGGLDPFLHLRSANETADTADSVMDINGDGRIDFVNAEGGGASLWKVYYGLATGGVSPTAVDWNIPENTTVEGGKLRKQTVFGRNETNVADTEKETIDLTGDGIPDFVDATVDPWLVYPGTLDAPGGAGFEATPIQWDAPGTYLGKDQKYDSGRGLSSWKRLVDMNADGRPDFVIAEGNPQQHPTWKVYLNTGSSFVEATDLAYGVAGAAITDEYKPPDGVRRTKRDLVDFNGDGLPDLLEVNAAGTELWVYLNDGRSFAEAIEILDAGDVSIRAVDNSNGETEIDLADVNADGLPDRVTLVGNDWWVAVNLGKSLAAAVEWPGPSNGQKFIRKNNSKGNTKVDLIDWNGDGFIDVIDARGTASGCVNLWCIQLGGPTSGPGIRPYLMTAAHNGIGGVSHARYGPSTRYQNTLLPFVSWLLTGTRRTDGLCGTNASDPYDPDPQNGNACIGKGDEVVRTYEYADGLCDGVSREFRGFGMVKERFIGPGEKGYREVFFNQAEHTRGQIDQEDVYADVGKLASREIFTWETKADGLRTQVWMSEHVTETRNIDTAAAVSQCKMERNTEPDPYGRVGTQCTLACGTTPDVYPSNPGVCTGLPSGSVSVTTTWADPGGGSDEGVRERPSVVTTSWMDGAVSTDLMRKRFFYDGLAAGAVDEGNVTRVETEMIGGSASENAVVVNGYDGTYGNITSLDGPGAAQSKSSYCTDAFQLYPTSERQCLISGCAGAGAFLEILKSWDLRYGKETLITGPNTGQTTAFSYDAAGRVECEAKPGDDLTGCKNEASAFTRTAEYTYVYGNPSAAFPENLSHVEVRTREPNTPAGYLVSRSYFDALGRKRFTMSQRVIGSGNTLQIVVAEQVAYDSQGRVVREYAPYTGWPVENPAPSVAFTEYGYSVGSLPDPLHRARVKRTPADQQRTKSTTTQYVGNTVTTTDQYNNQTVTVSDAFGREVGRALYSGSSSGTPKLSYSYAYDGLDRLLTSTVGSATVTRAYDSLGNLRTLDDPDSGLWVWDYDPSGNPIFQDDPKPGQHIEACYDKLNRVTAECAYADDVPHDNACNLCLGGPHGDGVLLAAYVYDNTSSAAPDCGGPGGKGQLSNIVDFTGTGGECLFYDLRGNVTRSEKTIDNKTAVMEFAFDEADHVTHITYPSAVVATYAYQADGLPDAISGAVSGVEYDIFGRITRLVRTNGTEDVYAFDTAGTNNFRLEALQSKKGTTATYLNLGYLYEDRGKLAQVIDARDGSGASGLSNDVVYGYDGLGRLTTVDWNEGQATYDEAFGHEDALGNLTCKVAGATYCSGGSAAFGLGSAGPHQPTSWGPYAQIAYDENGARMGKDRGNGTRQEYDYEVRGRMRQIRLYTNDTLQNTIDFTYDYAGQRVAKSETGVGKRRYFNQYVDSANGNITLYYYLGTRMVASYTKAFASLSEVTPTLIAPPEPIELPPALGALLGAGVLLLLVLPVGRRRLGVRISLPRAAAVSVVLLAGSAPVVVVAGCGTPPHVRHYHIDRLGTVQAVTDYSGNLAEQIRYFAYGEARGRFNAAGNPYTPPTTADDLRHEFTGYETDFASGLAYAGARWMDPELGQFQSLDPKRQFPSPYAYGPGDPVNGTDPTGEDFGLGTLLFVILVAAVAAAVDTYNQTGDWGAALKSFGLSIAGSVVGIGVGMVAGAAINAITNASIRAAVELTYQAVSYGGAAYGVADSLANGRPFSAGVAVGVMAYGVLSGESGSGRGSSEGDTPSEATLKPDKVITTEGSQKTYPSVHDATESLRNDVMAQPASDRAKGEFFSEVFDAGNGRYGYNPLRYYGCKAKCEGQWLWDSKTQLLAHSHPRDGIESGTDILTAKKFGGPGAVISPQGVIRYYGTNPKNHILPAPFIPPTQ